MKFSSVVTLIFVSVGGYAFNYTDVPRVTVTSTELSNKTTSIFVTNCENQVCVKSLSPALISTVTVTKPDGEVGKYVTYCNITTGSLPSSTPASVSSVSYPVPSAPSDHTPVPLPPVNLPLVASPLIASPSVDSPLVASPLVALPSVDSPLVVLPSVDSPLVASSSLVLPSAAEASSAESSSAESSSASPTLVLPGTVKETPAESSSALPTLVFPSAAKASPAESPSAESPLASDNKTPVIPTSVFTGVAAKVFPALGGLLAGLAAFL